MDTNELDEMNQPKQEGQIVHNRKTKESDFNVSVSEEVTLSFSTRSTSSIGYLSFSSDSETESGAKADDENNIRNVYPPATNTSPEETVLGADNGKLDLNPELTFQPQSNGCGLFWNERENGDMEIPFSQSDKTDENLRPRPHWHANPTEINDLFLSSKCVPMGYVDIVQIADDDFDNLVNLDLSSEGFKSAEVIDANHLRRRDGMDQSSKQPLSVYEVQEPITLSFRVSPEAQDQTSDESGLNASAQSNSFREELHTGTKANENGLQPNHQEEKSGPSSSTLPFHRDKVKMKLKPSFSSRQEIIMEKLNARQRIIKNCLIRLAKRLSEDKYHDALSDEQKEKLLEVMKGLNKMSFDGSEVPYTPLYESSEAVLGSAGSKSDVVNMEDHIWSLSEYKMHLDHSIHAATEANSSLKNEMENCYQAAVDTEHDLISLQDDISDAIRRERDLNVMLIEERRLKDSLTYQLQGLQDEKRHLLQENVFVRERENEIEGKQQLLASAAQNKRQGMEKKLKEMKKKLRKLRSDNDEEDSLQPSSTDSDSLFPSTSSEESCYASLSHVDTSRQSELYDYSLHYPEFIEDLQFKNRDPLYQTRDKFAFFRHVRNEGNYLRSSQWHSPNLPALTPIYGVSTPLPGGKPFWQSTGNKLMVYFNNLAGFDAPVFGSQVERPPRFARGRGYAQRGRFRRGGIRRFHGQTNEADHHTRKEPSNLSDQL